MIWINFIIFIFLILLQAYFSGVEIGFVSLYKIQILHRTLNGDKKAKILLSFYKNPHYFFSTILVGINIVSVTIATLFAAFLHHLGIKNYEIYAPFILLPFITIFGESLPKLIFQKYAKSLTFKLSFLLKLFYILLFPIIFIFSLITIIISKIFHISKDVHDLEKKELYVISNEILRRSGEEDLIYKKERFIKLISNTIEDIFTPYTPTKIHPNMSLDEIIALLKKSKNHTGYFQKDNKYYGIRLSKLLFSNNIEEAKEEILVVKNKCLISQFFFKMFQNNLNLALIIDDKNNEIMLLSREEISYNFIKNLKK